MINTPEQLALLSYTVNTTRGVSYAGKYFAIGADIDLGKKVKVDGVEQQLNWVPIGFGGLSGNYYFFGGTLKDDGTHVIKGLTIKTSGSVNFNLALISCLYGHVDGLHLKGINIDADGERAGAICGECSNPNTPHTLTSIQNCVVEDAEIVGGIVGGITCEATYCLLKNCVFKGKLKGMQCGGIAARYDDYYYDGTGDPVFVDNCHAAVDIELTSESRDENSCAGGLFAYASGNGGSQVIQFCSSSGTINGYANNTLTAFVGGLVGNFGNLNIENCTSSMSLSGGSFMGGLIGCLESPGSLLRCFSSSMIDATKGSITQAAFFRISAGGLVGYLENHNTEKCDVSVTDCVFAGTFSYNKESSSYYNCGSVVGYCNALDFLNENQAFNDVYVDKNMCGLPFCSSGTLNGIETKPTRELASQEVEGVSVGYEYCYIMPRDMMSDYKDGHNGQEVAFKDNFILASIPFYVSEGKKSTAFAAYYVTVPFSLSPLESNVPGKGELATFTLPSDLTFVEYEVTDDNTMVYPIDPGEADLTVALTGTDLTRTIHLNLAYGIEWSDDDPDDIFVGDGTKNTPYMIQNVSQLVKAAADNTKNREGAYFKLANDIFMNTHLIQTNETVKDGAREWTPIEWYANLDGNGKSIYGMYVEHAVRFTISVTGPGTNSEPTTFTSIDYGAGLFNLLRGNVHDLAIVDSYLSANHYCGLLCGMMTGNATIERCMVHGIVDGNASSSGTSVAGGMVGSSRDIDFQKSFQMSRTETVPCGSISDCFACVHVEYGITNPNRKPENSGSGGGIACARIGAVNRCVSVGKVEYFSSRRGIALLNDAETSDVTTWYFDNQQMTTAIQTTQNRGEHNTSELINGDIFTGEAAWQHERGRYPILRQFAKTPYGDLVSMPVHFAEDDRAGNVTKIFEFPTENVTWGAVNGDTYVDMINECGAATPMSTTPSGGFEYIYAQTIEAKSECTKALRVMALNTSVTGVVGIEFKDDNCEKAWKQVFGKGDDEVITLRNALTAKGTPQGRQFNNKAKTLGVEFFPEMRFFVGITNLTSGILSGLDQLSEVQLPNKLQSIGANALSGCTSLETITIPATTGSITPGAFDNSSLKEFEVAPRNEVFNVRCNALFTTGTSDLVAYPPARGESEVTISGAIGEIYPHAFYRIPQLDELYIDNPKPTGTAAWLDPAGESIVHWDADNGGMMDVYINDGTFDGTYDASTGGRYNGVLMKEYLQQDEWNRYKQQGKLHRYFPLEVGRAKWATMYIGFSTQLPPELKAYRVNKTGDYDLTPETTEVELKRMKNLLHHTTPVVIQASAAGTYRLMLYEGTVPESNKYENWLQGTYIGSDGYGGYKYGWDVYQSDSNEGSVLTLGYNSHGVLGFYYYSNPNNWIPPFKAYIPYNGGMQGASFAVYINDEIDDTTDGLGQIVNSQSENSKDIYNLNGQKIENNKLPKGVFIVNGKKVVVK